MIQHNVDTARAFMVDGIGKADLTAFDAYLSPDIIVRTGLSPLRPIKGLAAYKEIFNGFAHALPVIDFEIHELWPSVDGARVIVRFTAKAVFLTDYYGVVAQQQIVSMEEVHILLFEDGKIVGNIVNGTNFPFEYLMYPVLQEAVLGQMRTASAEEIERARAVA